MSWCSSSSSPASSVPLCTPTGVFHSIAPVEAFIAYTMPTLPPPMMAGTPPTLVAIGGVLTNMAVADGSVYAAAINVALKSTTMSSVDGNASGGGTESGDVEALNLASGAVEWDTRVSSLPLGAVTVSNDLVFTTLFNGTLIALNRATGAIVYRKALPTTTNAPLAVFGNTVLVPAGGPETSAKGGGGNPQLAAYTVSS